MLLEHKLHLTTNINYRKFLTIVNTRVYNYCKRQKWHDKRLLPKFLTNERASAFQDPQRQSHSRQLPTDTGSSQTKRSTFQPLILCRTAYRQASSPATITAWNGLPDGTETASTPDIFVSRVPRRRLEHKLFLLYVYQTP